MPHRRQTVVVLSTLYIFNFLKTEVMGLVHFRVHYYDVGSLSQYVITNLGVNTDADVKLESNVTAVASFSPIKGGQPK